MKALLKVNGHDLQVEANTSDVVDLINLLSKKKVAVNTETSPKAPTRKNIKRSRRNTATIPWSESETMEVVNIARTFNSVTVGAPGIIVERLRNVLTRSDSSIHNMAYRILNYMYTDKNQYMSKQTQQILDKNHVKKFQLVSNSGLLGRIEVVEA